MAFWLYSEIDLFNLEPIHAFSVLTAQTAIGGLPIVYGWIVTEPGLTQDRISLLAVVVFMGLALITFFWPLLGVHQKLENEKGAALAEIGKRIKRCRDTLHAAIDQQLPPAELDTPIKGLSGLKQELEFLNTISTWPWQADTFRGLTTALFFPVVLWFITHLLENFFAR